MSDHKFLILKKDNQIISLLYSEKRLLSVKAEIEEESLIGNIYIGKVKNVIQNIKAAFVEIKTGQTCFLSLKDVRKPIMLNRQYDGRILAEDELIVQVKQDAVKTKPPAVSTELSLSGKYCVLSMGRPGIAYSAKLSKKAKERIGQGLLPEYSLLRQYGLVIRTNARELEDFSLLQKELTNLSLLMEQIKENAVYRTCHSLLYKREAEYLLSLRDMYAGSISEIVTDEPAICENISEYSAKYPEYNLPHVRLYEDKMLPLYKLYSVESRLKEALGRKVWLKSGGYLLIEHTEALTVIDVNTGKTASKKNQEETYFNMNMEAASEIACQLSLRNISGIIIVDFINMEAEEHKIKLMAFLGDLLKKDKIKTDLLDMTVLGLVEITRMRTGKPLREQFLKEDTHEAD